MVAQRLASGNTFVAGKTMMMEVNPSGQAKILPPLVGGARFFKSSKLPGGDILCLVDDEVWRSTRVLRLGADSTVRQSFPVVMGRPIFYGGRLQGSRMAMCWFRTSSITRWWSTIRSATRCGKSG